MQYVRHMWNATSESNIRLFQSQIRLKVEFNSKLSNLIDSNVAFHMQLTLELYSAHVKCDVWTGPMFQWLRFYNKQ